jgi:hypothetical protein
MPAIKIHILHNAQRSTIQEFKKESTIHSLKKEIRHSLGHSIESQRLIYRGRVLMDSSTISLIIGDEQEPSFHLVVSPPHPQIIRSKSSANTLLPAQVVNPPTPTPTTKPILNSFESTKPMMQEPPAPKYQIIWLNGMPYAALLPDRHQSMPPLAPHQQQVPQQVPAQPQQQEEQRAAPPQPRGPGAQFVDEFAQVFLI